MIIDLLNDDQSLQDWVVFEDLMDEVLKENDKEDTCYAN
jgi:competence protein ComGF